MFKDSIATRQTCAAHGITSNRYAAAAISIALALNLRCKAEVTFNNLTKIALRSTESALNRIARERPVSRAICCSSLMLFFNALLKAGRDLARFTELGVQFCDDVDC